MKQDEVMCPTCNGAGLLYTEWDVWKVALCSECSGSGKLRIIASKKKFSFDVEAKKPTKRASIGCEEIPILLDDKDGKERVLVTIDQDGHIRKKVDYGWGG